MKIIRRIVLGLFLFVGLLIAFLYIFDFNYILKAIRITYLNGHKTAFLDDYKYFDSDTIHASEVAQPWPLSINYNRTTATKALEKVNKQLGTVAFVIIKNDSLLFESYYYGYDRNSKSNSFSMAKSIVSAAMGKAIMEGKIKSLPGYLWEKI